jgi:hypothetical protein
MASSRGPILLYALPLVAVAVLGVSTMVQTGGEPVRSALVLGGPTDSSGPFRGRVQLKAESHGVPTSVASEWIVIEASESGHRVERKIRSDESGWAEFEIPLKAPSKVRLRVTDQAGTVLAEGEPVLETARWALSAKRRGGKAPKHAEGPLSARIEIEKRVLAVPFEAQGAIAVWYNDKPVSGARVQLRGAGVRLTSASLGVTDEQGRFPFSVHPEEHVASLDVTVEQGTVEQGTVEHATAEHARRTLRFDQRLPVVPGAYGFRREKDGITVLAPVPREEAWFTFVREDERLRGGRIILKETETGQWAGRIPEEEIPRREGMYLVLSSTADGRSPSTVGYPLHGQLETFDALDAYLLDGAPLAQLRAEKKRRRIRWALGGYVAVVGILTLVLFVARVRRADRELRSSLLRAGASQTTSERSPLPLLIAVVGLFFAFSAGVLWIVAR